MNTFQTPRLKAIRLANEHLPFLVGLHLDPEVSRFLGGVRSPEATAAYVKTNIDHWGRHGFGLWTLQTSDGAFIGRAGLRYVDVEGRFELEIAYTFVRSAWGQGFATEIAGALVELWRSELTDPCLVGIVMKRHFASERVLEKVGLSYERDADFHGESCSVFRRCRSSGAAASVVEQQI